MGETNSKGAKVARAVFIIFSFAALLCIVSVVWHGVAGDLVGVTASVLATIVCGICAALFSAVEDRLLGKDDSKP